MSPKQASLSVAPFASVRVPRLAVQPEAPIPVWAIGETKAMTLRERKLTAAVYAQTPGVLEHVRREGRLPARVPASGREITLRALVHHRGIDIELTETEREVFDAVRAAGDAPEGWVVVIERRSPSS